MKTNEADIFIFIAAIIIGILISLNINFSKTSDFTILSAGQYQDEYLYKNKLLNDLNNLQDKFNLFSSQLNLYQNNKQNDSTIMANVKKELANNDISTGLTKVTGQGIVIVLDDATESSDASFDSMKVVHNQDLLMVMNDLKVAGAEAMSINDQRIVGTTDIYCFGPFVQINGVKEPAPFYIRAIGNMDSLISYMNADGSYINYLKARGISVDISKDSKIELPLYNGKLKYSHLKTKK